MGGLGARRVQYFRFVYLIDQNDASTLFFKALLNVGEVEKTAESGSKQPLQTSAAGTCGCNKQPCNCTKADVVFSDLYSTGLMLLRTSILEMLSKEKTNAFLTLVFCPDLKIT